VYTGITGGATVMETPMPGCAGAETGTNSDPNINRSNNPRQDLRMRITSFEAIYDFMKQIAAANNGIYAENLLRSGYGEIALTWTDL
jgi:hypothetical protein